MDTSLNGYYSDLNKALKKGGRFANYNKDMSHATIVVCTAFRHASEKIRLLSHELDRSLYGGVWFLDELQEFLSSGGLLNVLIESDVEPDHPVMQLAKQTDKITIKRVPDQEWEKYPFNFMVVDDKGFRFENNRALPEATVVFNYDEVENFKNIRKEAISWFDNRFNSIEQKVA